MCVSIKDTIRASFHRFCDGTGLHGFIEMYYAKSLFWTITWVVVVIGAWVVTIVQVRNALIQFTQESSITQIIPLDVSLMYPPMSMCYIHWIYWVDWKKAFKLNMTKETVLFSMSFMTEIFSPNVFNVTEANENLTRIMSENNIASLTALYKNISRNFPMILGENGDMPVFIEEPLFFTMKEILYKDSEWYLCYTVSGEEILKILEDKKKSSTSFRTGGNKLNFSMQDPNYSLYSDYIGYDEYNFYMAYWLCRKSHYFILTLSDFTKNYTQFTLPIKLYMDAYSTNFEVISTDNDFYVFDMTPTVHRWKDTRQSPCLENQATIYTEEKCEEKCRAKHDNKIFTCMELDQAALLDSDNLENLCRKTINFLLYKHENPNPLAALCNMFTPINFTNEEFENDQEVFFDVQSIRQKREDPNIEAELEQCVNDCVEPCEQWKYVSSMSVFSISQSVRKNTYKNQTDIYIAYPEESDVLVIEEIDAQTWEDFVGNIGGLLGVWTGASLISFLQACYLLCCSQMTCLCCNRSKLESPKTNVKKRRKVKRPCISLIETTERVDKNFSKSDSTDIETINKANTLITYSGQL